MQTDLSWWDMQGLLTVAPVFVTGLILLVYLVSVLLFKRTPSAPDRDLPQGRQSRERGPKVYPVLGSQVEFLRNINRLYDWTTDYIQKDPTQTFRLKKAFSSKYVIETANPQNIEYVLKANFPNYPKGETLLGGLRPLLGDGIFNTDGDAWRSQRKVASYEFSTKTLRDFVVEIVHDETYHRLLPLLAKVNAEGTVVDIQELLLRFGFDNICRLGFGIDMGCLDPSLPEIEFAHAFDEATRLTLHRLLIPNSLYPVTAFLASLGIGGESRLRKLIQSVDKFALSIIQKRRTELTSGGSEGDSKVSEQGGLGSKFSRGHGDLLSRFIQHEQEVRRKRDSQEDAHSARKDEAAMSDKYLRDIILNFVLAGRDTSSVALTWFFWLLSEHPQVEKKIVAEITSILRARKEPPSPEVEGFTYDELKGMHYLQAAITESMRLYPPVPGDVKTALADDYLPDGTFVQGGSRVSFNLYAMGRTEGVWGKDCLQFKPERFLQDGKFLLEDSSKYPIFLAGPRVCLGKEMAYTQMKYVVAAIFSSPYRFQLLPKPSPKYELSLTLKMKDGLEGTVMMM